MKPRVMVVTAGRHQAPVILKAKELGYEVLATDGDPGAPGLALADHAVVADALNASELLRIAQAFRPQAIVTEQTDVAVPAVAAVAEQLGRPGIGADCATRATDKWAMRQACRHAGIPAPEYRLGTSIGEITAAAYEIGLPVVVKPSDNQASRGVTKILDALDLPAAAARALAASRSGRVLVEECMSGAELSVESFIRGDIVDILGISEKTKCAPPHAFDLELIYPGAYAADVLAEIRALNTMVIRAIGLKMGFAHAEMIITPKGVRLIEIAARGCGARIATDLLPRLTGVDLLAARLRQALGESVDIPEVRQYLVGILRFFQFPPGTVRHIKGLQKAARQPGVIYLDFTPVVGTTLLAPESGDQRPGFVLGAAPTRAKACALADKVVHLLEVDVV